VRRPVTSTLTYKKSEIRNPNSEIAITVWDKKRKLVWLAGGLILGTWVSYWDSFDDDGTFVPRFFIFMESLVVLIIGVLFWIYSRKKQ
jgi:hypothetical protein